MVFIWIRILVLITPCLHINFLTSVIAKEKKKPEDPLSDDDVFIVYELTPTPEQKALASKLKLPPTFFCYKNRPDYVSEEDDDGKSFMTLKCSVHMYLNWEVWLNYTKPALRVHYAVLSGRCLS